MGDVVYLKRNGSAAGTLELVRERVETGEIVQVGVCYVTSDGSVGHTWSAGDSFGPLLGSMHYMASQLATGSKEIGT